MLNVCSSTITKNTLNAKPHFKILWREAGNTSFIRVYKAFLCVCAEKEDPFYKAKRKNFFLFALKREQHCG